MENTVDTVQKLINTLVEYSVNYGFQVLGALIVLGLGFLLANWVGSSLMKIFEQKKFDITLSRFLAGCARVLILGFALLIALGKFGITIAPFLAAISAMAFGASFAIQGPLSNYGAGLSIILSRPFKVGDTIMVAGVSGLVQEVKLACTILINDGVKITIPNKDIVGQIIHNWHQYKVAQAVVGISYDPSPEKAIQIIGDTLQKFSDVAKELKPQIGIEAFADSSINISYRYWIVTARYFQTFYAVNLAVYNALSEAGIKIPYPQREIRITSQATPV